MTLLTRLALSAFVLSMLAVATAPSASAECTGTVTTPYGASVCTDHPVDPVNTCEAVVYANAPGVAYRAYACTDYQNGSEVCLLVVHVGLFGVAPLCS